MSTSNIAPRLAGTLNPLDSPTQPVAPNQYQNQGTSVDPPSQDSDQSQSNTSRATSPHSSDAEIEFDSPLSSSQISNLPDPDPRPEHPEGYVIVLHRDSTAKAGLEEDRSEIEVTWPGHYTTLAAANAAAEEQFWTLVRDMGRDPDDPTLDWKDWTSEGRHQRGKGPYFLRDLMIDPQWFILKVAKVNPSEETAFD